MFCNLGNECEMSLINFTLLGVDVNVLKIKIEHHDTWPTPQARINGGDLMSTEAKYHLRCVSQFKMRSRIMLED